MEEILKFGDVYKSLLYELEGQKPIEQVFKITKQASPE